MSEDSFQAAVLGELQEQRKLLERTVEDLSVRVAAVEQAQTRKTDRRSTIISAIVTVLGYVLAAFAGCGCVTTSVQHPTPAEVRFADQATALIEISVDLGELGAFEVGQGTGTFVEVEGYSTVLTAAHVCNAGNSFKLKSADGSVSNAVPVFVGEAGGEEWARDVCLMVTDYVPTYRLRLAHAAPQVGDPVWFFGYPLGTPHVGDGVVSSTNHAGFVIASLSSFHGASGSALLNERSEIVGVIVRGVDWFPNDAYVVPLETVRAVIRGE